jgi:hypothetical protein
MVSVMLYREKEERDRREREREREIEERERDSTVKRGCIERMKRGRINTKKNTRPFNANISGIWDLN